jgi:hypothetical protein
LRISICASRMQSHLRNVSGGLKIKSCLITGQN